MSVCTYRADEVEFLASMGTSPAEIMRQLDVKADTLARSLYRAGRGDLAQLFTPIIERERRNRCADCDASINRCSKLCRSCAMRRRYGSSAA